MKTEKTLNWVSSGKNLVLAISLTRVIQPVTVWMDESIDTGRVEAVEILDIVVTVDGKYYAHYSTRPYAYDGKHYLAQTPMTVERYSELLATIDAMAAEVTTPEWDAENKKAEKIKAEKKLIAEKNQKEIAEYEKEQKENGLCPKCHSYCYGDCQAA